jgi:hypothetical protein
VSATFEANVFALEVDEFRDTEPSLDHREQERMVSTPDPRVSIGSFE